MKEDVLLAELRDFVREELPRVHPKLRAPVQIGDDEALFESGILDSLAVVHLVTYLEKKMKRPLELQEVNMGAFRSLRSIAGRFAGEIS
jgi:acyl carrier protein